MRECMCNNKLFSYNGLITDFFLIGNNNKDYLKASIFSGF